MKYKDLTILLVCWALLFVPYIFLGGMIRDDLGFVTDPPKFSNCAEFQWHISSNRDMTARPVSAILIGISYWFFRDTFWAYRLANLALFLGSVIFFYLTVREIISRNVALLAAIFSLVYPCASGTLFSSIMMNSNLAALLWSSASFVLTQNFRGNRALSAVLFLLSSLSYESFIPLFIFVPLTILLAAKPDKQGLKQLTMDFLSVAATLAGYIAYRGAIEKIIFHSEFSRITLSTPIEMIAKFIISIILGFKIAAADSVTISLRALNNIDLVSAGYSAVVLLAIAFFAVYFFKKTPGSVGKLEEAGYIRRFAAQQTSFRVEKYHYLNFGVAAIGLFLCAHLIFAISYYIPNPLGFENRTLGGIRFVTALSMAVFIKAFESMTQKKAGAFTASALSIALITLFTFSIIGQREAWIEAARYNDLILNRINHQIRAERLYSSDPISLIAILPDSFPNQVNQEPIFGAPWDITPALALSNPGLNIKANVYNPSTTVDHEKVTIISFTHRWEASYPFWLYKFDENILVNIASEEDWRKHTEHKLPP